MPASNSASGCRRIEREKQAAPAEVVFLGEDALPALKEYLNDNSRDEEVIEIEDDIEEVIQRLNWMNT